MSQREIIKHQQKSEQSKTTLFPNKLITKKEVATTCRVTVRTIEKWMRSGDLKFMKMGDKMVRLNPDYLNEKFGT